MDLPTRAELFEVGAQEIIARNRTRPVGQRISTDAIYLEGSDVNVQLAGASAMADECMRQLCHRVAALYLDSAESDELDRLVADRFSPEIVRKSPQNSIVTLSFTRVAGTFPALTLTIGSKTRTQTGVEFRLTSSLSLASGSSGPATALAEAIEVGSGGNVEPWTITEFIDAPPDAFLQVTNPERAAGGDEKETDPRLRARARRFFQLAQRGTLRATEQGALTVGGVAQATAYELLDSDGLPNGFVQVAIADVAGQSNSALRAAVILALREFRAGGIIVDVLGAAPLYVPVVYKLRFTSGTDSRVAFDQISLTTIGLMNALAPGETLERAALFAAAKSVPGVIVLEDAVVAPLGDVVPTSNDQVLRTRADLVTSV